MNNETKLDGALCAGVGTADAAQAAPAGGKKKYVPPTMQVIPLGPQRMLATSGEVLVRLAVPSVDYYFSNMRKAGSGSGVYLYEECGELGPMPICPAIEANSLEAGRSAWLDELKAAADAFPWRSASNRSEFEGYCASDMRNASLSFQDVGWDLEDFFARASFDNGCDSPITGTYNGQRFRLSIASGTHYCPYQCGCFN